MRGDAWGRVGKSGKRISKCGDEGAKSGKVWGGVGKSGAVGTSGERARASGNAEEKSSGDEWERVGRSGECIRTMQDGGWALVV
eukprot:409654-Rhodomonas_salina.3